MVSGTIEPSVELTVRTQLVLASVAICGPSSVPAASIAPVIRASWSEMLSTKSTTVSVST